MLPRVSPANPASALMWKGPKVPLRPKGVRFTSPTTIDKKPYIARLTTPMASTTGARNARRMARLPRLDLPGVPQHVVQRGNNRLPCFLDDEDRQRYLQLLLQAALATQCQLHAYVLMDNHVHLLTTPANMGAVSRMMQMLGRSYVARFNARHGRTGTLWEGRYKSCLVDSVGYVLTCHRYIELNPVRARMVESPDQFPWSSYAFNALGQPNVLLTPHSCYQDLGSTNKQRAETYRLIISEALPQSTIDEIRLYLQQQRALGRDAFRVMVEAKTKYFAGVRAAHRPCKRTDTGK